MFIIGPYHVNAEHVLFAVASLRELLGTIFERAGKGLHPAMLLSVNPQGILP